MHRPPPSSNPDDYALSTRVITARIDHQLGRNASIHQSTSDGFPRIFVGIPSRREPFRYLAEWFNPFHGNPCDNPLPLLTTRLPKPFRQAFFAIWVSDPSSESEPSTCSFGACRHSFAGLSRPQAVGGRHVEVVSGTASQVPQGVLVGVTAQSLLLPVAIVCLVVKSVFCKKGSVIVSLQS
ncbi:hypothetical protein AVEN_152732-1 [Araneus ventricosus]|uniref:Uncharacterized protein n=1 Tax=Araneus ventricosus TaxID=182803 RepID=A0A4Y2UI87_ARAVE|nr:hypothetical protein AVEN_260881-1 [Araneus ventricosus]GBO12323.1 hypothetical protein AVEN_152732-1 [Araneus ventricosus]